MLLVGMLGVREGRGPRGGKGFLLDEKESKRPGWEVKVKVHDDVVNGEAYLGKSC